MTNERIARKLSEAVRYVLSSASRTGEHEPVSGIVQKRRNAKTHINKPYCTSSSVDVQKRGSSSVEGSMREGYEL